MIKRPAIADYPAGAQLRTRVLVDYELVWMLRGRARLTLADGEGMALSPDQLLLVPPGVAHRYTWDPDRPSRHGYVHFTAEHFPGRRPRDVQLRPMTAHDPLAGLCAYLLWLARTDHDGEGSLRIAQAVRLLLTVFVSGPLPTTEPLPVLPSPLVAAIDHLRREWSRPSLRRISVAELADAASVSRSQLSRLFRGVFGRGPAPAMERARLSRAEMLLHRTDLSVAVIGRRCGFADLSHFSHRFVVVHGMSPSAYRAAGDQASSVLDQPGTRRLAMLIWE